LIKEKVKRSNRR